MSLVTRTLDVLVMHRRRLAFGAKLVGLGLAAGLSYGLAVSTPASAADALTDWHGACVDKGAPQGSGQMPRADNCARQQACQDLANAANRVIFEAGCFGVAPEARPAPSVLRR